MRKYITIFQFKLNEIRLGVFVMYVRLRGFILFEKDERKNDNKINY